MGTNTPHDGLFRAVFSRPELAAEQLRQLLPRELVANLDLTTLKHVPGQFVDESLSANASDVLFEVRLAGRPALVYVLYEHQSAVDPLMAIRVLIYEPGLGAVPARAPRDREDPRDPPRGPASGTGRVDGQHPVP